MGCGASRSVDLTPAPAGATASASVDSSQTSNFASKTLIAVADPSRTAVVRAWPSKPDGTVCFPETDDPDFAVPALESEKVPFAICISGGGFRAATLGLGWLRALHTLGVLQKAKYLCTCSGSSWLSSALCFQRVVSTDDFLGPYLPPEQCTLEALNNVGPKGRTAAAVLADAEPLREYVKNMAGGLLESEEEAAKQAGSWSKAMAAAFLSPFGLGDTDASTVACSGTKGCVEAKVAERAVALGRGNVFTANLDGLPFPIIVQVIMLACERIKYYPVEWTPLYSGCPVRCSETSPKLGAGWLETVGLNAALEGQPEPAGRETGAVHVRVRPMGPASLGEAIGISSAYNAQKWALGKSPKGKAVHKALGFSTAQYFDMQDWCSCEVELADGGGIDYYALFPALRRRMPAIVVCSASRTRIEDPKFACYMQDLAGLFGSWPGNPKPDKGKEGELTAEEWNRWQQVFPPEGFPQLCAALREAVTAGRPPVHVAEYEVLDNAAQGIRGGWRVRIMWVVNDRQPYWEAALPAETRQKLEGDRTRLIAKVEEALNPLDADTLRTFPHVSTFAMNYTPLLVGLMANHAAHMVMSSEAALRELVEAVRAQAEGPSCAP